LAVKAYEAILDNGYTLLISILSGLFGALISAFLSFKVRVIAQNKIKKDLEHRIAYVYVSQLSFLVAANVNRPVFARDSIT